MWEHECDLNKTKDKKVSLLKKKKMAKRKNNAIDKNAPLLSYKTIITRPYL